MKLRVESPLTKSSPEKKMDASKTNLQVCSILLAAISLSLKLSDLSQMLNLTKVFVTISIGLAMVFLTIAIFLEADAIFYYSREKEEWGEHFDKYGYKAMKGGLLCVLIVMNYLAFSLIPPLIVIPVLWSELLQASLPTIFALISYMLWRIFKCRKIQCKWYM